MGANSLGQSCQTLTLYPVAAFEIRLVFGEMNCLSSKGSLLQRPPSSIKNRLVNIAMEVVGILADVANIT